MIINCDKDEGENGETHFYYFSVQHCAQAKPSGTVNVIYIGTEFLCT